MEVRDLSPTKAAPTIFQLYLQTAIRKEWHANMQYMPCCHGAGYNPQACCHVRRCAIRTSAQATPSRTRSPETWEAIAERRNSDGQSRVKHFQASSATDASKSDCVAQAPPASRQKSPEYVYTCPFCNGEVTSSIASGHIDHRHVCGKQFRLENGSLRPTMRYAHTCPTCGTCVHSSKEAGRIQSKHKQPNGRACPQTEWQTS